MEVKDYCNNVSTELTFWKARIYDVVRKMDKQPTGNKEKIFEDINGLHIIMDEIDERLDALRNSCPTDWKPEREEISNKLTNLSARYNDAAGVLFDYDLGG